MEKGEFLALVKETCQKHGVELELSPENKVLTSSGIACSGYFSDNRKKLAVATGKPEQEWFQILAHEFGHLNQWVEGHSYFKENKISGIDIDDLIDLWFQGHIELNESQLKKYLLPTILVEKDCEERVVGYIDTYSLPIEKKSYTKMANAYVLSYHAMMKNRLWPETPVYKVSEIVEAMPDHFNLDYINPPKGLIDLIERLMK